MDAIHLHIDLFNLNHFQLNSEYLTYSIKCITQTLAIHTPTEQSEYFQISRLSLIGWKRYLMTHYWLHLWYNILQQFLDTKNTWYKICYAHDNVKILRVFTYCPWTSIFLKTLNYNGTATSMLIVFSLPARCREAFTRARLVQLSFKVFQSNSMCLTLSFTIGLI